MKNTLLFASHTWLIQDSQKSLIASNVLILYYYTETATQELGCSLTPDAVLNPERDLTE